MPSSAATTPSGSAPTYVCNLPAGLTADVRHRPCSLRRGVRRRPFPAFAGTSFLPSNRGERSAEGRIRSDHAAHLTMRGRLSALHCGVLFRRRAALLRWALGVLGFPNRPSPAPSASSSQRVVVPAGGAPAPPGCRRSVRLLPAGATSCSIIKTPLDDALVT